MKTIYIFLMVAAILVLGSNFNYNDTANNLNGYTIDKMLEVPLSSQENEKGFTIKAFPEKGSDYFTYNLNSPSLISESLPVILKINSNFLCVNNDYECFKIYNLNGEKIYEYYYDSRYYLDFSKSGSDNESNLYLHFKNYKDTTDAVYIKYISQNNTANIENRITARSKISKKLNIVSDVNNNEQERFGVKYGPGTKMGEIPFLAPQTIITENKSNKQEIDKLVISSYFDNKFVYVRYCLVDNNKNIFIAGYFSNDMEIKSSNITTSKYLKIYKPIFFIWKFKKQN